MKKPVLLAVAAIAVLAAGGAVLRWATEWRFMETTDDAYVEGDITNMAPKVSGHVIEVAIADNQSVKAGDVLVRLDDRDFKARVAEARALVAARMAAAAQLDDKVAVQQAMLMQAGAGIASAQADLKRSRADLSRTERLVKDDFVSRQRFDSQAADAAKAEASVRGTSAQAMGAKRQMAVLEADRDIADAQLEQARALLALAESDLDSTIIRAPADGVIGNRVVRPGMYVRIGQHLLSVVPLATVWIDANFKETQIGHMHPGNTAEITVDAFPDMVITGTVTGFSPASGAKFSLLPPENATGNFTKIVQRLPVRIQLPPDNPLAGRLRPGLSVTARVDTRTGQK
ncbi:MAG: HlyD family secretion protein [Rhodospirillaceae bacterium]|nr:HlyD family secretion protein [Rhodospirillales bacterium]